MENLTFTPEEVADIRIALVNAQADFKLSVKNRLEGSIYDPLYEFYEGKILSFQCLLDKINNYVFKAER